MTRRLAALWLLLLCLPLAAAPTQQWTIYLNNRPFAAVTNGPLESLQVEAQAFANAIGLALEKDAAGHFMLGGTEVTGGTTVNGMDYLPLKAAADAAGCTLEVHKDLQLIDIRQKRAGLSHDDFEKELVHAYQIVSPQQMDYLYDSVQDKLKQLKLNVTNHTVVTHWCSLQEIRQRAGADAIGWTSARVRAGSLLSLDLYVPLGLPPSKVLHSMAHELGHCWQYDNGIYSGEPMKMEGFAEWVAFKVLENLTLAGELAAMHTNNYEQYRDGLAYFQKVERTRGFAGVLDEMRAAAKPIP